MKKTIQFTLSLDQIEDSAAHVAVAARTLKVRPERITAVRIRKRSIDARRPPPRMSVQADVYLDAPAPPDPIPTPSYAPVPPVPQVVIVGCGPAGMFAALRLIELAIKPVIIERGKDVQTRRRDLAAITRRGEVNPDSNYCFGEGGAGTYSDGKLYTRSHKRGDIAHVLQTLVAHGAKAEILQDTHPHIGSNKLPDVVAAMRRSILEAGGEIHFNSRVSDFIFDNVNGEGTPPPSSSLRPFDKRIIRGVVTADGRTFEGQAVILATGHSARDIFELCLARGVTLEAKSFAMGVRIEHPQPLIDRIQYHSPERHPNLPAASYRLAHTVAGRGVFSFCMCPGGWIVPAATAPDEVVVNGMSLSRRDSPFANSGLVVAIEADDLAPYAEHGPLAGLAYQKEIEAMAYHAGGGAQKAPAQRVPDFVAQQISADLPRTSYQPGLTSAPLHELLPPALAGRLAVALQHFGRIMPGYFTKEAIIVGVESRTSSPVRIPRNDDTLQHPAVAGLYPCGEGGGYAGGIVSAALDGIRVAEAIVLA